MLKIVLTCDGCGKKSTMGVPRALSVSRLIKTDVAVHVEALLRAGWTGDIGEDDWCPVCSGVELSVQDNRVASVERTGPDG